MYTLKIKSALGRTTIENLPSLEAVSARYCELRNESGEGMSTFETASVYKGTKRTHTVSYNGKVWKGGDVAYNPYAPKEIK